MVLGQQRGQNVEMPCGRWAFEGAVGREEGGRLTLRVCTGSKRRAKRAEGWVQSPWDGAGDRW